MVEGSIMSRPDKIDTQGMTASGINKDSKMLKTTHYINGYPSFIIGNSEASFGGYAIIE